MFAANRARGSVNSMCTGRRHTRRRHLHESGSLRVRFPSPEAEGYRPCSSIPRVASPAATVRHRDRNRRGIAAGGDDSGGGKSLSRARAGGAARYHLKAAAARISPGCRRKPFCSTGPGIAADRYRTRRNRLAVTVRNRGVRPRRDGRADAAWQFTDRWRIRRGGRLVFAETVLLTGRSARTRAAGDRERRRRHRYRADRAGRRDARRADPQQSDLSRAKSGYRRGTGLQWPASVHKMRPGFGPT